MSKNQTSTKIFLQIMNNISRVVLQMLMKSKNRYLSEALLVIWWKWNIGNISIKDKLCELEWKLPHSQSNYFLIIIYIFTFCGFVQRRWKQVLFSSRTCFQQVGWKQRDLQVEENLNLLKLLLVFSWTLWDWIISHITWISLYSPQDSISL